MEDKTTLDDLAGMVNKGFDATQKEFDSVHKDIKGIEGKVSEIDIRLEDSFRTLNHRIDYVVERVDRIEQLLGDDYRGRMEKLEEAVQKIKNKVGIE